MTSYKHTQIGYLMIVVTLLVMGLFVWMYSTAAAEPPSVDSGTNLLVTGVMTLIVCVLASFTTLTVSFIRSFYLDFIGINHANQRIQVNQIK